MSITYKLYEEIAKGVVDGDASDGASALPDNRG